MVGWFIGRRRERCRGHATFSTGEKAPCPCIADGVMLATKCGNPVHDAAANKELCERNRERIEGNESAEGTVHASAKIDPFRWRFSLCERAA
jgi:hypothetical protein